MEGFYATIDKGESASLAVGPFSSFEEAFYAIPRVRIHILTSRTYAKKGAHLWTFGVQLKVVGRYEDLPTGKLNEALNIIPTAGAS